MSKRTLDHHMGYFQYLNTTIYGKKAADTIVEIAATVGASYLILGEARRNMLINLLRGSIIRNISSILPEEIHLLVYA